MCGVYCGTRPRGVRFATQTQQGRASCQIRGPRSRVPPLIRSDVSCSGASESNAYWVVVEWAKSCSPTIRCCIAVWR